MAVKRNQYFFDDFVVQSYFDEEKTRLLFEYVRVNGLIGRTAPPRKGFIGMVNKLLWKKKFEFEGENYIVQGGGKQIAFFEFVSKDELLDTKQEYQRCIICQMLHPIDELLDSEMGVICSPCYDVWFPLCEKCGERMQLPEGVDPDDGPFICEECWNKNS